MPDTCENALECCPEELEYSTEAAGTEQSGADLSVTLEFGDANDDVS